ncbi:hypothetical protein MPTK1_4g03130 [Marchantia polymorpha subsp. ruderalis]|uniref:Uncharacterized protein n=2 Tax=Marchantia polymorpha TaxID=3197 RepID=A0AAF6B5S2_MARPO|nr:hypothetical protein MARPO_0172s0010 [Marchantia polymorpha]BBN07356.1 hypothetical protein Mp_4g03130 [Marchantia polymorpha subsp. ruderalis]|eukprot:PTQ28138.1 hypothetical protein MARPO_0172s0010 [Marchantia polymorpha]
MDSFKQHGSRPKDAIDFISHLHLGCGGAPRIQDDVEIDTRSGLSKITSSVPRDSCHGLLSPLIVLF